jgi:hypothetical protein
MLDLMKDLDEQIAATEAKLENSLAHDPQRLALRNQLVIMQTLRKILLGVFPTV